MSTIEVRLNRAQRSYLLINLLGAIQTKKNAERWLMDDAWEALASDGEDGVTGDLNWAMLHRKDERTPWSLDARVFKFVRESVRKYDDETPPAVVPGVYVPLFRAVWDEIERAHDEFQKSATDGKTAQATTTAQSEDASRS